MFAVSNFETSTSSISKVQFIAVTHKFIYDISIKKFDKRFVNNCFGFIIYSFYQVIISLKDYVSTLLLLLFKNQPTF